MFKAEDIPQCLGLATLIRPCISFSENEGITNVPSDTEIFDVFKSLNPSKAPGPDGMFASFYQKYWNIVGSDVCHVIENVFRSGLIPRALNRTSVVLIPKVKQIFKFNHIRPISLCNTIYKVISKILAGRIKQYLPRIISSNQAGFVPGRWIGENTILVNEITHSLRRKKGVVGIVGIKIDMQKAYDGVDWKVLSQIMYCYGISARVVNLLSQCSSVESLVILLNGNIVGNV